MRPEIQVGSKVKVVDKKSQYYRWRGSVSEELIQCSLIMPEVSEVVGFICTLHSPDQTERKKVEMLPSQLACVQKKFIDIEHIREEDIDLGNGVVRRSNTGAFEVGDIIQISEKIDGANASVAWNADEGKLEIFSRTNLLNGADGLRGFVSYIKTKFPDDEFKNCPDLVIFGEWCVSHKARYEKSWYSQWRVYDIWDKTKKNYLPQSEVKKFCEKHGIEYIHVLYEGPFVSWNHCKTFMDKKTYGGIDQEGVVVKNQTKLDRDDIRFPKYLKIVNDSFKESSVKKEKEPIDPEKQKELDVAKAAIESIVTEARVSKIVLKLADEGLLPRELTPRDMGTAMKQVPKLVFDDILKEEPEVVKVAGENAGKMCSQVVAKHCKKLILGVESK